MRRGFTALIALLLLFRFAAGQYAPAATEPGSTAIHRDSSAFIGWAEHCTVERGYIKISDTSLTYEESNRATLGLDSSALGYPDGSVVSLGDRGSAVLSFEEPIYNGEGPDFAVFENGFKSQEDPSKYFLELAFVEVSSDSLHWVRFPALAETASSPQIATFDPMDPEQIHNLAGKYQVMYGTPFDLEDIRDSIDIDLNHISYIRIVDVVGCIHPSYASYDAEGRVINDPWPTPFSSGGFDLDAVGVIHSGEPQLSLVQQSIQNTIALFPNPARSGQIIRLTLKNEQEISGEVTVSIYNSVGALMFAKSVYNERDMEINLPETWEPGIYHLSAIGQSFNFTKHIILK